MSRFLIVDADDLPGVGVEIPADRAYAVCVGGAAVRNGEHADPTTAIARAEQVFAEAEKDDDGLPLEPVQILLWTVVDEDEPER